MVLLINGKKRMSSYISFNELLKLVNVKPKTQKKAHKFMGF